MPTGKEWTHHSRFLIHPFVVLFDTAFSNFSSRAINFDTTEHLRFDGQVKFQRGIDVTNKRCLPLRLFLILQSLKGSKQNPVGKMMQMCLVVGSDAVCLASPDLMYLIFVCATNQMTM